MVQSFTKENLTILTELYGHLLFDPAIPILRIYPEKRTPKIQKYICVSLFIETFVITKYWNLLVSKHKDWLHEL